MKRFPDMIETKDGEEAFNRRHVTTVERDKITGEHVIRFVTGEFIRLTYGHPAYDALVHPKQFYSDRRRN